MTSAQIDETNARQPLRLWPGVTLVVLQWLGWWAVPILVPDATFYGIIGGLLAGPVLLVWWAFFSRAPRFERFGAVALVIVAMAATPSLLHESVAKGNMGMQFVLWGIPIVSLAFVSWAVTCHRLAEGPRRAALVATVLLTCGAFTLVRSKGVTGDGMAEFTWRWTETPEQRLLAQAGDDPASIPPAPPAVDAAEQPLPSQNRDDVTTPAEPPPSIAEEPPVEDEGVPVAADVAPPPPRGAPEWPGFRGPDRTGVIPGLRIATDWSTSPPSELWRRPIGPGVSSFAVGGDLLYTQEQRGEAEIVSCHAVTTGKPVWRHQNVTRFEDTHVGAGPRATPALGQGRVYTLGATGLLNAFDAADGTVVWSRDASADTEARRPLWGYVSSPLVVDNALVVHAGALMAYDLATGEPRWFGPDGGSYSSPQLLTLDGVAQILLLRHAGMTSVAPADGKVLWEHPWDGVGIMQPALTADADVLISMVDGGASPIGTRRLAVSRGPQGWTTNERWTSNRLKPSFSQVVIHEGHAYGFDGRFLASIDVEDGKRKWKGGRYGSGQLVLLPDQDLLLVVSERGELALVKADPDEFLELARFPAIEGKTWNQPALVDGVLLVRNGQEMAAFRLPLAGD